MLFAIVVLAEGSQPVCEVESSILGQSYPFTVAGQAVRVHSGKGGLSNCFRIIGGSNKCGTAKNVLGIGSPGTAMGGSLRRRWTQKRQVLSRRQGGEKAIVDL